VSEVTVVEVVVSNRHVATSNKQPHIMPRHHIAVLGGGLSGLSSAFHLSRRFPDSLITLFERKPSPGGWVSSERVQVRDADGNSAEILLESGPRTLRPNAKSLLELVRPRVLLNTVRVFDTSKVRSTSLVSRTR